MEINVWGPKNFIEITVNNDDTIPDNAGDGFQFISSNNYLLISHKNKNFKSKAEYTIALRINE